MYMTNPIWPINVESNGKFLSVLTDPHQPLYQNNTPVQQMCISEVAWMQLHESSTGSNKLSYFWNTGCVWWSSTAAPSCIDLALTKYNLKVFTWDSEYRWALCTKYNHSFFIVFCILFYFYLVWSQN